MSRPNDDPLSCLKEIALVAWDRMNSDADIAPLEAFALGQITGIATRQPEVVEYLKAVERNRESKEV